MIKLVIKGAADRKVAWEIGEVYYWAWWDEIEATDDTPYEIVWLANQEETAIRYIEDLVTRIPFFLINGAELERTVNEVKAHIDCFTVGELLQLVRDAKSQQQFSFALYRMAIAMGEEPDQEVQDAFEYIFFNHLDPMIREVALGAASYIAWDEMKLAVRKVYENDMDSEVRSIAQTLLEAYRHFPKNL